MKEATKNDFKVGISIYDANMNEFIIKNEYDKEHGIWETNKGRVVYSSEARFYKIKE